MINDFLVRLTRLSVGPVNPASTAGDVLWPEYTPAQLSAQEQSVYDVLFVEANDPLLRLLRAIQLLWVVLDSPLEGVVTRRDARITYDTPQLLAQFSGTTVDEHGIVWALSQLPDAAPDFLPAEFAHLYRASVVRLDKLAAAAAYFGTLHD